eukprot:9361520-Pyramimonas_sp.AAC.1
MLYTEDKAAPGGPGASQPGGQSRCSEGAPAAVPPPQCAPPPPVPPRAPTGGSPAGPRSAPAARAPSDQCSAQVRRLVTRYEGRRTCHLSSPAARIVAVG